MICSQHEATTVSSHGLIHSTTSPPQGPVGRRSHAASFDLGLCPHARTTPAHDIGPVLTQTNEQPQHHRCRRGHAHNTVVVTTGTHITSSLSWPHARAQTTLSHHHWHAQHRCHIATGTLNIVVTLSRTRATSLSHRHRHAYTCTIIVTSGMYTHVHHRVKRHGHTYVTLFRICCSWHQSPPRLRLP